MLYPSVDELVEKVGNRYELVMIIAKRARQITDTSLMEKNDGKILKPLTIAIHELHSGELKFKRPDFVQEEKNPQE